MVNNSEKFEIKNNSVDKKPKQRIFTDVQADLIVREPQKSKSVINGIQNNIQKNIFKKKVTISDIYDVYNQRIKNENQKKIVSFFNSHIYNILKYLFIIIFFLTTIPCYLFNEVTSLDLINVICYTDIFILILLIFDSIFNIYFSSDYKSIVIGFVLLFITVSVYCTLVILHLIYQFGKGYTLTIYGFIRVIRIFLLYFLYNYLKIIPIKSSVQVLPQAEKQENLLPIDKILQVLSNVKEQLPNNSKLLQVDIDYCIDIITKNKFFSPNILNENPLKIQSEEARRVKEEICFWIQNFAKYEQEFKNIEGDYEIRCETPKNILREFNEIDPLKMQEKISKFLPNLNTGEIIRCFKEIYTDKFNVFELSRETNNQELFAIVYFLFYNNDLLKLMNIRTLKFVNFCKKIQNSYRKNPYHNSLHATDVVQTINFYMTRFNMNSILKISQLEKTSLLLGAMIHDVDHPGKNNTYLIANKADLALNYNDKSVLENHHVAFTFKLLNDNDINIFENFSPSEYKQIRKLIINIVLCTDLAIHFDEVGHFRLRAMALSESNFQNITEEDKIRFLSNSIHFADISNQTKRWNICFQWTENLYEEFFAQGDEERNLGITIGFLNDRYKTNIGSAQIGFIERFISPSFETFSLLLPLANSLLDIIESNKKSWKELIEYYDKNLKELEGKNDLRLHQI